MGFFSAIGSALSSAASAIGGAISSGLGCIGSALRPLGSAVGAIATSLGGSLGLAVAKFIPVVGEIAMVVQAICMVANALGLFGKDEKPEELAVKAEQADKKPEDFDSTEEYINYLKNEVELDKEKFDSLEGDELKAYQVAGSAILLGGISEKMGIRVEPTFIRDAVKAGIKGEKLPELIQTFKENGATTNLEGYFKGDLTTKQSNRVDTALETGVGKSFPDLNSKEVFDKITQMREEYFKKID